MAMTKKELAEWQAKIDALKEQLGQAEAWNAFKRTDPVARDLPPPAPFGGHNYSYGWDYNLHAMTVGYYWSTSTSHGDAVEGCESRPERSSGGYGSQGALRLYSTKLKALRALRHAIEKRSAHNLRRIDMCINNELSKKEES